MINNSQNILSKMNKLAIKAGEIAKKRNLLSKTNELNPSTNVDKEISEYLSKGLKDLLDIPVLSEEGKHSSDIIKNNKLIWVIDPLDGTLNYLVDNFYYAISVSLVDTNNIEAILASNYIPQLDQMYYASKGNGVFINNTKLHPKKNTIPIINYGLPFDANKNSDFHSRKINRLIQNNFILRQSGSAIYDIIQVSLGKAAAFFEFGLFIWDFIGADLIAKELGCKTSYKTTEIRSSKSFRYDYFVSHTQKQLDNIQL